MKSKANQTGTASLQSLIDTYEHMTPDAKKILQFKAVAYHAIGNEKLLRAITGAEILNHEKKSFTLTEIAEHVNILKQYKLLTPPNNNCHLRLLHYVTKIAAKDSATMIRLNNQISHYYTALSGGYGYHHGEQLIREFRVALYTNSNFRTIDASSEIKINEIVSYFLTTVAPTVIHDGEWILSRQSGYQKLLLHFAFDHAFSELKPCPKLIKAIHADQYAKQQHAALVAEYYLWQGDFKKAEEAIMESNIASDIHSINGVIELLTTSNVDTAIQRFIKAITALKKTSHKRHLLLTDLPAFFYIMCLISTNQYAATKQAEKAIQFAKNNSREAYIALFNGCKKLMDLLQEKQKPTTDVHFDINPQNSGLLFMVLHVANATTDEKDLANLTRYFKIAAESPFRLISYFLAKALSLHCAKPKPYLSYLEENRLLTSLPWMNITIKEHWQMALESISDLGKKDELKQFREEILIWYFNPDEYSLVAMVKSINKAGEWSKPRRLNLEKYWQEENHEFDFLTHQDRKIINALGHYYNESEEIPPFALMALINHPNIFNANEPDKKIELVPAKPKLILSKHNQQLHLDSNIDASALGLYLLQDTDTRFQVIDFKEEHQKLNKILGAHGLEIPLKGKEQVLHALEKLGDNIDILSDIENKNLKTIKEPSLLHLHLLPYNEGLQIEILIRPAGSNGPYFKPGDGPHFMTLIEQGERIQIKRNHKKELLLVEKLLKRCPTLAKKTNDSLSWIFLNPSDCLQVLKELKDNEELIQLEWPEGERFHLNRAMNSSQIHLKIKKTMDWFDIDAEVELNADETVTLKQFLNKVEAAEQEFIPLANGQFLALTKHFKNRIKRLKTLSEETESGLRVHSLSAHLVDQLLEEFENVKTDNAWQTAVAHLKQNDAVDIALPENFHGTLRPYQQAGFEWMSRLSHWGVGACLADDMGLGKTVQTIALLLKQANQGPSLIIAPTSLIHNWQSEINEFAPSLTTIPFIDNKKISLIKNAEKNQIILTSYGLIQTQIDLFKSVNWNICVLDEAQAIKNPHAKRSMAANKLHASFKLVLTGTPIENHLGELWSLFHFLNPGLLGSEKSFMKRFLIPIEQNHDKICQKTLSDLLKPFILRRTKFDVLKELPPKTEQLIEIEFTDEERHFYNNIRESVISHLNTIKTEPENQRHIKILAEIMRLRQACCSPKLIDPNLKIGSSKITKLRHLILDLLDSGHKALVFSQFVRFLTEAKHMLDEHGIDYHYMDGSTPTKQRKEFVNDFQNGNGDVFLLSLKTGGVGLNLTAADYVILLDPWWNPAVEDQAADRVHRIGQEKPVTIYRLIAENTIEQKIIELHQQKRELANHVLDGTDISSKLSDDDLLKLIIN